MPPVTSSSSSSTTTTVTSQQNGKEKSNAEPIKSSVTTFTVPTASSANSNGQIMDLNSSKKDSNVQNNVTIKLNPTVSQTNSFESKSQSSSSKSLNAAAPQQPQPPPPPPVPRHRNIDSDEIRVMQKVLSNEV